MNTITVTGNVVENPEARDYGDSRTLASFRIGNNEMVNGNTISNGFFDITVFGPQAQRVLNNVKKGDRLLVAGRLQHTTFERPDGSRGGRVRLIAQVVAASMEFEDVAVPHKERKED